MRSISILVLCMLLAAIQLEAAPRENEFGAGAVSSSLAGAGLASLGNPSATYLNPANLAKCRKSTAEIGIRYIGSYFKANQSALTAKNVNLLDSVATAEFGACYVPIEGFGVGAWVTNNALRPMTMNSRTTNNEIYFTRFGDAIGSPTLMAGVGYAFVPWVSLGVSVLISTRSSIRQDAYAPISIAPNPFKTDIAAKVSPRAGVVAGLSIVPFDFLSIGGTFRTENYGRLEIDAITGAKYLIELAPIHMTLVGLHDYSPRQYGIGITGTPLEDLNLYADLNYAQWSLFEGPFMTVTPDPNSAISLGIELPPTEVYTFKNVFIPRFGVEYAFSKEAVARAGYSYHPSIIGRPVLAGNLIDNDTHQFSLGGGYNTQSESYGFRFDAFVGLHYMPKATVAKTSESYTFGGFALATGFASALEF